MYPMSAEKCAGNTSLKKTWKRLTFLSVGVVNVPSVSWQVCWEHITFYTCSLGTTAGLLPQSILLPSVPCCPANKSGTTDISTHTVYNKDRTVHCTFKALDASCILVLTVSISINIFIDWAVFSSTLKVIVNWLFKTTRASICTMYVIHVNDWNSLNQCSSTKRSLMTYNCFCRIIISKWHSGGFMTCLFKEVGFQLHVCAVLIIHIHDWLTISNNYSMSSCCMWDGRYI